MGVRTADEGNFEGDTGGGDGLEDGEVNEG